MVVFAGHLDPSSLPLTQDEYEDLYAASCGTLATQDVEDFPPPDSKLASDKNNLFTGEVFDGLDDTTAIAIWANAEQDPKELTLDISGQRNVINGDAVSRSHLKISASDTIFAHATEYGERSAGKEAFDLSGEDNCFNLEPDQVARNRAPQSPDGFPFESQFDSDGDGNILEHFLLGSPEVFPEIATYATANKYYRCLAAGTIGGPINTIPGPLVCDMSSGKISGGVQGGQMPSGLYVASGEVSIAPSQLDAIVTVVSGKQLDVSGSVQSEFFPFHKNLLFASQWDLANNTANTDKAEDALKTGGSFSLFTGITVSPNGRNEASGSQNSWTCPIMGDRVRLNGSLLYVSGDECGAPGLRIEKTPDGIDGTIPDGVINAGDLAVFKITVTNSGNANAENVTIDDTLPGTGWTENPDTLCTITGGNVLHCNVGTLAPTASFTVFVQRPTTTADCTGDTGAGVRLDNGSQTTDTSDDALANATGVPPANDPGSILVKCPDTMVEKAPDGATVNAGTDTVFNITVTALGPGTSFNVNLSDPLPNGGLNWEVTAGADQPPAGPPNSCQITGAVGSEVLTCSFGDIPNGQTRTVQVTSPTDAADCGPAKNNLVTITGDGDINAANNSNTGSFTVICGAIRIFKDSTKGDRVNNAGAVFSVDGPDGGDTPDFSVTDDITAEAPDEDADVGEICVDGLVIGGTYTVNETSPPAGYGAATGASNTNLTVVAVAGSCPTGAFNSVTFTNPPLGEFIIDFNDLGSGETSAKIDCVGLTPTPPDTTSGAHDDNIERYTNLPAGNPPIVYTCTISMDP
jgi:uncharacterized repeat protein (TIGR01451 family)